MMPHHGNSSVCPTGDNDKLEETKNNLISCLKNKFVENFFIVRGKHMNRDCWSKLLVDWDKKKQFLEESETGSSLDVYHYGKVLDYGFDEDFPISYPEEHKKYIDNLHKNFLLIKLKVDECMTTYYVVADDGRGHEIMAASSEEELRLCGRILYSSNDEDPPESLVDVINEEYFGLAEHNCTIDSRPFDAARKGELQKVTKYLEEGGDVNSIDKYGWTLVHHAAHCGNMELIRLLKDSGANVQTRDKMCGRKPVHIAAREGHSTAISFFLSHGASVNEGDKNNWTLLHYAAWKGDLKTVRFLIQLGADIQAEEASASKKPIHVSAEYGHNDVIELLLENNADIDNVDEGGRTPLYYSVSTGHLETAKCLIGKGADINVKTKQGKTLLHLAALVNDKEIIEYFLDAGLNIDAEDINGLTPLIYAAHNDKFYVVRVLVDRGANFNAINKKRKALFDFIGKRNVKIVWYLADRICQMFQDQGKYQDALQVYKETLEIVKENLGPDNPETLETQNKVGKLLYEVGQYDEAMVTFKYVLEKREGGLGSDHFDTLRTKHGLGLVYKAQTNYRKAMEIFNEVFKTRGTRLGFDHDDTLNVSRDIAYVHFNKGEYEEALEVFKDVFEKRNTHFDTDHPKTLQARQDMAVVLLNKGDYKMALNICKEVLEKRKLILGNNHPDTVVTLHYVTQLSQNFEKELQKQNACSIQ